MFGLFKKKPDPVERLSDLSVRLFMVETAEQENRRQLRLLIKQLDEAKRVETRMANTITDQTEQIRVLTEQVALNFADIARIDDFNEAIAEFGTDGSIQVKINERNIAALYKRTARIEAVVEGLKSA
jgi:hypothetical protein